MERHQSLYKETTLLAGRGQKQNENRERQNESRAKDRKRIFLSRRNIEELDEEKENASTTVAPTPLANSTHIDKTLPAATVTKQSRQQAYLQRLIKWKASKEQNDSQKMLKRPPFIPAGCNNTRKKTEITSTIKKTTTILSAVPAATKSFAPKNHKFTAPVGLRNPTVKPTEEPVIPSSASKSKAQLRQSFYTVVPTPPRKKKPGEESTKKTATLSVFAARNAATPAQWLHPKTLDKDQQSITPATLTNKVATIKSNTKTCSTLGVNLAKSNSKPTTSVTTIKKTPVQVFVKPRQFKLPAASPPRKTAVRKVEKTATARIVKPIRGKAGETGIAKIPTTGAVGKARLQLLQKRATSKPVGTAAKLSVSMKAKKPAVLSVGSKNALNPCFKLGGKMLLNVPELSQDLIAETPKDFDNVNPFGAFITSTKIRSVAADTSSAQLQKFGDGISPVEALHGLSAGDKNELSKRISNQHASSAAKRALLNGNIEMRNGGSGVKTKKKKFNFVLNNDVSMLPAEEPVEVNVVSPSPPPPLCNNAAVTSLESKIEDTDEDRTLQKTPSKEDNAERPANYLSPFVSVSRGKVNLKKEREKRNSIYLQQPSLPASEETLESGNLSNAKVAEQPQPVTTIVSTPVEVRRTLETVRYFRQQLNDEIARLHVLCDQWESYKSENLGRLQETGGEDMINVTIGQTKLLTSKKFMQFSGLIDRCEAGARGTGVENDGSEDTKPISTMDLEGFWCMVGLQVDNVEKRFDNLTRWKANDWLDPDTLNEVSSAAATTNKPKKNLNKVRKIKTVNGAAIKAKAKPSSALQQMLRKMHANMRKNKDEENDMASSAEAVENEEKNATAIEITATTPNHKRRSNSGTPRLSTPRRISVIVRDRKSRSAAATVISIPTPTMSASRRDSLVGGGGLQNSPVGSRLRQHVMALRRRSFTNNLQKAALIGAASERHQTFAPPSTPPTVLPPHTPKASGRKSILKTPGTANGKKRNVIFDQKVYVKKFKFTVADSEQSEEDE